MNSGTLFAQNPIDWATGMATRLDNYRGNWPVREPDQSLIRNEDERRQLGSGEGVATLEEPPEERNAPQGSPPRALDDPSEENKHLWVILPDSVPYILEAAECAGSLKSGVVKHTNLTGGGPAHSGGELWFRNGASFWMSGASGRYKLRGQEELDAIVDVMRKLGYAVASLGWDEETRRPWRILRGEIEFRSASPQGRDSLHTDDQATDSGESDIR